MACTKINANKYSTKASMTKPQNKEMKDLWKLSNNISSDLKNLNERKERKIRANLRRRSMRMKPTLPPSWALAITSNKKLTKDMPTSMRSKMFQCMSALMKKWQR
mmetsp:Transcript_166468/g.294898  ORF Transcript_166468/g.294898 Transcript_166468/m.294898 type:complete len:105 (-) Transcript_166468:1-315(-)